MKPLVLGIWLLMNTWNVSSGTHWKSDANIKPDTASVDTIIIQLGETLVTAFNKPQKLLDVPGSLTNIGQVVLDREQPAFNLLPVLQYAPGVFAHEGATNTNRITIRGIGARVPYATGKIRAYFNQIPLTNTSGVTFIQDIDPAVVQSIDVIKGPATSVYGAGLGGTIAITAREPSARHGGISNHFQVGSFGYWRNSLTLDISGEVAATSLVYSHTQSDGYRQNNEYRRDAITSVTQMSPAEATQLTLLFAFSDLLSHIPSSIDSLTYWDYPERAASHWLKTRGYEDARRLLGGISVSQFLTPGLSVDMSLFTTWHEEKEMRPFDVFYEERTGLGARFALKHKRHVGFATIETALGGEGMMENYLYSNYENMGGEGIQGNMISDNREQTATFNIFMQSDLSLGQWIWSGGVNVNQTRIRYTDLMDIRNQGLSGRYGYGTIISPRLSTSFEYHPGQRLYATISHGFAPPSLAETLTPEGSINPDIKPEESWNLELGFRGYLFSDRLYYDVGIYRMRVQNLLVAERVGEDAWVGKNAGESLHQGIETAFHWVIIQKQSHEAGFLNELSLRANHAYNHFFFTDFSDRDQDHTGNRLPGIPRQVTHAGLYAESVSGMYGSLNWRYVGSMAMNDANTRFTSSYSISELTIGYKNTPTNRWGFSIFIKTSNLFNRHYPSMILVNAPSFGGPPRYYYPGLPRHFRTGIQVSPPLSFSR